MQPDSVTQVFGLLLVEMGVPSPFAALLACLMLVAVPLLIGGVVVALIEHVAEVRAHMQRPRGATRIG